MRVGNPEVSVWSSHREYLGLEMTPGCLKAGYVLAMFSDDADEARAQFYQFVMADKGGRLGEQIEQRICILFCHKAGE
jgi:hypothetical protein